MIGSMSDRYARRVVSALRTCLFALLALLAVGATAGESAIASASPAVAAAPLQVPGEGDLELPAEEGPEGDLPVAPAPTEPPPTEPLDATVAEDIEVDDDGAVAAENRRILLIVLGLVAVAIAITLLTIRYWRQTKPVSAVLDDGPQDPDVDSDRGGGTAAIAEAPDDEDDAYDDLFEPVAEPPRRSRRAVAGADHPGADDLWIPRGTGEHDRVEIGVAPVISRPTSDQRAAALQASRQR